MPQQIVDTNGLEKAESSTLQSTPANKAFRRRPSFSNRNASGQKKKTLCGNATRW